MVSNFKRWGVDTEYITTKSVDTGVAQINVTDDGKSRFFRLLFNVRIMSLFYDIFTFVFSGENYIIIVAGANGTLQEDDVNKASRLFLSEASVILFQFETPLETTEYLLNRLSTENNKCNVNYIILLE